MGMNAKDWLKSAEANGWRLDAVKGGCLHMICGKLGCEGVKVVSYDNPGPKLKPCALPHRGQYSQRVIDQYDALVDVLRQRRRALGLSQEDVTQATGLSDGHINKLEALHRIAELPTLQTWAQSLGLVIAMLPSPLPAGTIRVIDERKAAPYRPEMARHKKPQGLLFDAS